MSVLRLSVLCVLGVLILSAVRSGHGSEIIGGKEVVAHSLPYMALLRTDKDWDCGGILIDAEWVLTAAHCPSPEEVLLGVHAISKDEKEFRQKIEVMRSFAHPCFSSEDKVNDLMLLKLKKAAKQTQSVKWLPLGQTVPDPKAGTKCLVAGWGATGSKKWSDVLLSANVTVVDRAKCNSRENYNFKPVITNDMICAGRDGRKETDTSQGDSGGPLLCHGALVGVTSFGKVKKPGVYSFLSKKQLSWIRETMKKAEML